MGYTNTNTPCFLSHLESNNSKRVRTAREALNHYAVTEVRDSQGIKEDRGDLVLPVDLLGLSSAVPEEIARRICVAALMWVAGGEYPPRDSALRNLRAAMTDGSPHTLAGCLVESDGQFVRFAREYNALKDVITKTDRQWDGRWRLEGPHAADVEIRALGEALKDVPDWREADMPRRSLLASPAIWRGGELIAAPVAGLANGWTASATGRGTFSEFLLSR